MITANVKPCLAATTGICSALLSLFAPQAEARDPLRESIRDASGREILVLVNWQVTGSWHAPLP